MSQLTPKFKITLGNHDQLKEVIKHYQTELGSNQQELYYSYEDEYLKYIFLDSSNDKISEPQFNWLKTALQTTKNIVLFIHHPILEVNTAVDKLYFLQNRVELRTALHACTKPITIFCAHYHMDDEQMVGAIRQYITPALSYQIKKDSTAVEIENNSFGYRIITIVKDNVLSAVKVFNASKP